MADRPRNLRHIFVPGAGELFTFRNPRGGGGKPSLPARDARAHSKRLLAELDAAIKAAGAARNQKAPAEGYQLTIRSAPGFELPLESLDSRREDGAKLLASRKDGEVTVATIFVPLGGLAAIQKKLTDYGTRTTPKAKAPLNAPLVANMESIGLTVLKELWGEPAEPFPSRDTPFAWEAWLRNGSEKLINDFVEICRRRGLVFGRRPLRFPDRAVVLVTATARQLASAVELVDCLAELRKARLDTATFFELQPKDQAAWTNDLADRTTLPGADAPVVCIFDTGVNSGHPLLTQLLPDPNMFAYLDAWGKADHDGHGTEMAGLATYGELTEALSSNDDIVLEHGLESVKILPPVGANPPDLYGSITIDACAQPEFAAPDRRRVFSMAVTTADGRTNGRPSSWSAALDALAAGRDDGRARLFCVSIGNAEPGSYAQYPDSNQTTQALDPSQAWNVLTVGAYTDKVVITEMHLDGWTPLAPQGDLSPTSSTSLLFDRTWPVKPEVVLEGGNVGQDSTGMVPHDDSIESLRLLTTNWQLTQSLLTSSNATSAATSQAARLAAQLMAEYPNDWPETIRALIVHSARWTDAMEARFGSTPRSLLRTYGYGVPLLQRARWSAQDALTLVVQSTLHPFRKEEDGGVKAGEMRLHKLPWPREALLSLVDADVRLRVTLSYFVEPNPAERGWRGRYSYASHQLRFDMQRPAESAKKFAERMNKELREPDYAASGAAGPAWRIGAERDHGSCHSDVWHGRAADLALREHIAVYPVGGWWKEDAAGERWRREVRYSLVVSVETDDESVDLYTPVAAQVQTEITVDTGEE
jgi:hypothetical protein